MPMLITPENKPHFFPEALPWEHRPTVGTPQERLIAALERIYLVSALSYAPRNSTDWGNDTLGEQLHKLWTDRSNCVNFPQLSDLVIKLYQTTVINCSQ